MVQTELLSQQKLGAHCLAPEGGCGQAGLWSVGLSSVRDSLLPFMSRVLRTYSASGAGDTAANQTCSFLEELTVWGKLKRGNSDFSSLGDLL